MMISTVYGQVATPSENNSDYSGIVSALGGVYATPANTPTGNVVMAATAYMNNPSPGGTFATYANMTRGLPQ